MLDINGLMAALSSRRPIFHSEADFQHALAWLIHETMPEYQVRLEYPFLDVENKRRYLDVWLPSAGIAVELKYHTRRLEVDWGGESFALREQAAQDILRYDFLKDVQRLEFLVAGWDPCRAGFAILLTNTPLLWDTERSRPENIDSAFHLYEGRGVDGELAWSDQAGAGTTRNRESPILLNDSYNLRWRAYSDVEQRGYGEFRYLAVSVG